MLKLRKNKSNAFFFSFGLPMKEDEQWLKRFVTRNDNDETLCVENSSHLSLAEFGLKLKAETDPSATLGAQYSLQRAFSRHFYTLQGAKFPVASPMGYGCISAPI